jgi:hypothetical protein
VTAGDQAQLAIDALTASLARSQKGTRSPGLQLSDLLEELDEWLADDRQWNQAGARHWASLLTDLSDRLRFVASMSEGALQVSLKTSAVDLRTLRGAYSAAEGAPDEALRRRLRQVARTARAGASQAELLLSAFRRLRDWARSDVERADGGVAAFRNLIELQGHDPGTLLDRVDRVLRDSAWEIAVVQQQEVPDDSRAVAGMGAADRIALAEAVLDRPPPLTQRIVWLEFLQARLPAPWVLEIGPHITLFAHDFLRPTLHQAPNDGRIPEELREDSEARGFLTIWLDAYDAEQAVRADHEVYGDPRVFLRVELDEMPSTRQVLAARETAEFLVAFGSLGADNHDLWALSDSYFVVNGGSSTAWRPVNADRARDQLPHDETAAALARNADLLASHLPLRARELRMAGRLLIWLREATRNDNPARLVLCDRVVEQVAGWAGVSRPSRLVADFVKPSWVYDEIRRTVHRAYIQLMNDTPGAHALTTAIEEPAPRPPFSQATYLPGINLKAVLENLDALIDVAPEASSAWAALTQLRARTETTAAVAAWVDALESEFGVQNDRLRRTRNALMHGGPLVSHTVDDSARFAEVLAHHAIDPAVYLLLEDQDIVDGFLARQQRHVGCFAQLRDGTPASEALFWD